MKKILTACCVYFCHFSSLSADPNLYADPYESCCEWGTVEIGAEWLYWKLAEERLVFGADVFSIPESVSIESEALRPNFRYRSGYRLFANYCFPCTLWNIEAAFTHAPSSATRSAIHDPASINFINITSVRF